MRSDRSWIWLSVLSVCLLASLAGVGLAQELLEVVEMVEVVDLGPPYVSLNDGPLATDTSPPILVMGRILVPVKDLFTAIGGEATRDATLPKYSITRGDVAIELAAAEGSYQVGNQELTFTIAPVEVGNIIYVDVSDIIQDGLGGTYVWNPATMTAALTIQVLGLGSDVIQGDLVVVYPGLTPYFLVRTQEGADPTVYTGVQGVQYFLQASESDLTPLTIDDLNQGDRVGLTLDQDGKVTRVVVARSQIKGTIKFIGGGHLFLTDLQHLILATDVQVTTPDGAPYDLGALRENDKVALTVNEADGKVLSIVLEETTAEPVVAAGPTIALVAPLRYEGALKAGERLPVRLRGTPGGVATADIGDKLLGLPFQVRSPGDYRLYYTVKEGDDLTDQAIVAHLKVGDAEAPLAYSEQLVTLDTKPPQFLETVPHFLQSVDTASPTIQVRYADGTGSGVDPASVKMTIDNQDVTDQLTVDEASASYQATDLTQGYHVVEIDIADRAGNVDDLQSMFNVARAPASKIRSVQHTARNLLVTKDKLTVTMEVEELGNQAYFTLGDRPDNIAMLRVAGANSYRGHYTVRQGDELQAAKVTGYFVDNTGRTYSMEATTLVDISTRLPDALAIISPQDREKIKTQTFEISGEAPPNRQVRVIVQYEFLKTHTLAAQTLTSDAAGKWKSAPVNRQAKFLASLMPQLTVVAQLLDAGGNPEDTKTITVLTADEEPAG